MFNFNNKYVRPVMYFSLFMAENLNAKSIQQIDQDFALAGSQISSLLDDSRSILNHGCWCSKLDSTISHDNLGGVNTIDDLDSLCKQWHTARRCIQNHEGPAGSCYNYNSGKYQLNDGANCSKKNNNNCEQDSCLIDMEFHSKISNFLAANPSWSASSPLECPLGGGSMPTKKFCYGEAPLVWLSTEQPTTTEATTTTTTTEEATTVPPCSNAEFDMTILVDGSASIPSADWIKTVDFIENMSNNFDLGQDKTRVTIAQFSYNMKYYTKFIFDQSVINDELSNLLNEQYKSATMTNVALHGAMTTMEENGRPSVPQILVVITDGVSSRGLDFPSKSHPDRYDTAAKLHDLGITTFVIAIGDSVSDSENKRIASDPDAAFLHNLEDFDSLNNIVSSISNTACGMSRSVKPPSSPNFVAQNNVGLPEFVDTELVYGLSPAQEGEE